MENQSYVWTDNPTVSGVSPCDTDVLNECLMHLKYNQQKGDGFQLFDIKITDRKLVGEEAVGWVIQGGLVTMTYPDAVNKIIEEFEDGATTTYRGISCVQSLTGHYIADIAQKNAIDKLFSQTGIAEFYILDKTNQQFYLPRNKWFLQLTTDDTKLNQFNEAGLPNITGSIWPRFNTGTTLWNDSASGCLYTTGTGSAENRGEGGAESKPAGLGFSASRSSSIYGKSSTVQPISGNKLLYYKVGNVTTGVGQILIDAEEFLSESTQQLENTAQDGLESIETAIGDGIYAISNASNALKQNQISNCLLEVPQKVKVELDNGALTLEAGSVVIVPYGTSAPTMEIGETLNEGEIVDISWDGEKLFYYVKYDSDKVYSYTPSSSYDDVCFIASGGYALSRGISSWFSGSSAPDYERQYQQWYDTMNNIVKHSSDYGQSWTSYDSFPFCVASVTQSVGYINIKNIFNGFGFIGSTIWCDKGVKGLASNGRNADGSLKNIEYTFSKLTLMTANVGQRMYLYRLVGYETACRYEYLYIQDEQPDASDFNYTGTNAWFSPRDNYWRIYEDGDWNIVSLIPCAYADCGLTTAEYYRPNTFKTKQSFQALDYNDTEFIAHQAMPGSNYISLSLPASEGTLVAPADGYAVINASSNTANAYISLNIKDSTNTIGILQDLKMVPEIGKTIATSLPVAKGELIQVGYYGISLNSFRFVYANGSI